MAELKHCLVLGVGNVLMGDDGLGSRAVRAFEARYELPPGVEVIDGGTGGLALLELLQGFESVIVIDAILSGAEPGTIERYGGEELKGAKHPPRASAHQVGLYELIETARFSGHAPSVTLIGVVPEKVLAGSGLSKTLQKTIGPVTEKIVDELRLLGIECKARPVSNA